MELSIREAATLLGKSARTVRNQVTAGKLEGFKRGGRWVIPRHALPLDAAQRRRMREKATVLRAAVEGALPSKGLRLDEIACFAIVRGVLHSMNECPSLREDPHLDEATVALAQGLLWVGRGHYRFAREAKLEALRAARDAWSDAATHLSLTRVTPAGLPEWRRALQSNALPQLGGLIRWADGLKAKQRAR